MDCFIDELKEWNFMKETKEKKSRKPILAPLYVLKEEKIYWIWVFFVFFFGLINIWAAICLGEKDSVVSAMEEGIVYTYSISICAPFLAEMLIKVVGSKRENKVMPYVWYHMITAAINVVFIIVLTFLWTGSYRGNIVLQIIIAIAATAFSFYMYCILQMEKHEAFVGEYDDCEYLRNEKSRMNQTEAAADKLVTIDGEEGEIEI